MNVDLLLLHIARTQQAQGEVLACLANEVHKLVADKPVDPALQAALAASKVHHKALKTALDAQS